MDEAARARDAATDALDDISPSPLYDLLAGRLAEATMTPGVLTLLAARATDRTADPVELDRRAAGVQLIYDGLQLTRGLARSNPWEHTGRDRAANLDILAADVLVARGFYLLSRTEAAEKAVETVRAFGRDETTRATTGTRGDGNGHPLEADVFELAVVAGSTATGREPPATARSFAVELAASIGAELPTPADLLEEPVVAALADHLAERDPSVTVPNEALPRTESSVTDP